MAWYKKGDKELQTAEYLADEGFMLTPDNADEYPQGADGWHWFDSLDLAIAGINAVTQGYREVESYQAETALLKMGVLDDVLSLLATQPDAVQILWKRASKFRSNNPTLLAIANMLGWSNEKLNQVFDLAETL